MTAEQIKLIRARLDEFTRELAALRERVERLEQPRTNDETELAVAR